MRIEMQSIGGARVLAGAMRGKLAFARLVDQIAKPTDDSRQLFLDFSRVDTATASYLRESVLALRNHVRGRVPRLYPVVANLCEVVADEFRELVMSRREVIVCCELNADGIVSSAKLIGDLEAKQRLTFDLVVSKGAVDATTLMRDYGDAEGTTRTTAWNNRLSALAEMGLIIEDSLGRAKRYRALFEDKESWA